MFGVPNLYAPIQYIIPLRFTLFLRAKRKIFVSIIDFKKNVSLISLPFII